LDLPEDEQAFLRDFVKTSWQKPHVFAWVNRDGTQRQTALRQTNMGSG
jgi:phosphoribosylaminoimidazole (AIR) synthetase